MTKPKKPLNQKSVLALSARKQRALEEANRLPVRDPITLALFGIPRPCLPALLTAPGRVYHHLWDEPEEIAA